MANVTAPVTDLNAERYARGLEIPKPLRGQCPSKDLSFMKWRVRGGHDYWTVKSTGSIRKDFEFGRKLADEYLDYIGQYHNAGNNTLLACIVQSMGKKEWSPVNVAFLNRINRYAVATAAIMELGQ